jgi:hypothetical protein
MWKNPAPSDPKPALSPSNRAALRSASNERWKKLHRFLSEIGVKALRTQIGQTLGIGRVYDPAEHYEANIQRAFGSQQDLFRR